jgi:hypothetical protein
MHIRPTARRHNPSPVQKFANCSSTTP